MADKFNPFHKWLGLNPKLTNPHHFQLLGVGLAEKDEAKIQALVRKNAEKHLTQLGKVPPGKLDPVVNKLKARITEAERTLIDPGKRQAYLNRLRAQVAKQKTFKRQSVEPDSKPKVVISDEPQISNAATTPEQAGDDAKLEDSAQAPPVPPVQASPDTDVAVAAPVEDTPQPAIPMAVPLDVGSEQVPIAGVADASPDTSSISDSIGDVKIKSSFKRRKRNRWVGPLIVLFMLGTGAGGVYFAWKSFAKIPGIAEEVRLQPGIETKEPNVEDPKSQEPVPKLEELDPNKLKDLDVEQVMKDSGLVPMQGEQVPDQNTPEEKMAENKASEPTKNNVPPPKKPRTPVQLSNQQQYQIRRAVLRARRSLFRRDKKVADEQIAVAKSVIAEVVKNDSMMLDSQQQDFEKIVLATDEAVELIGGFWGQVVESAMTIPGSQELKIGEQIVAFLEADQSQFILRNAGSNIVYQYHFTPPGLALAIAKQGAVKNVPRWSMQQAAFFAVNQISGQDQAEEIDRLCKVAEDANYDCERLRYYAEFDFENFALPESKIEVPEKETIETTVKEFREKSNYRNPDIVKIEAAASLAEILLSLEPEDPIQRVSYLEEARRLAVRGGDALRAEDAIIEMADLAKINVANVTCETFADLSRNRLTPEQTRALMEVAIPFLKGPLSGLTDNRKRKSLVNRLNRIAESNSMVDCVRRLKQLN